MTRRRTGVYPGSFNPPTLAHLAVADAARHACGLDVVELVLSLDPLGKEAPGMLPIAARVEALNAAAARHPWLAARTTTHRLLVDISEGADALVLGADKWAQLVDPAWYGSAAARDAAIARLPLVAVAPRPPHPVPDPEPGRVLVLDLSAEHHEVSATAVRAGRHDWVLPEAAHLLPPAPPPRR